MPDETFCIGIDVCDEVAAYEICLLKLYGAVIGGNDLPHVMGYPSSAAFRQAVSRRTMPVQTFKRPGYRMRFARTHDIAKWLVSMGRELPDDLASKAMDINTQADNPDL